MGNTHSFDPFTLVQKSDVDPITGIFDENIQLTRSFTATPSTGIIQLGSMTLSSLTISFDVSYKPVTSINLSNVDNFRVLVSTDFSTALLIKLTLTKLDGNMIEIESVPVPIGPLILVIFSFRGISKTDLINITNISLNATLIPQVLPFIFTFFQYTGNINSRVNSCGY